MTGISSWCEPLIFIPATAFNHNYEEYNKIKIIRLNKCFNDFNFKYNKIESYRFINNII